jgi:hypothetical protein
LKESICSSDDIDKLTPFEETIFYRLMVNADDYGRMDARPNFLKSKLFVTKQGITEKNVEDAVSKLASVGLVRLYEVDGKSFLLFPKWNLHQRVRNSKEKYPAPQPQDTCGESPQVAASCCRNPIQSESESNPISPPPSAAELETFFETLWSRYPRKEGKGGISKTQKQKLHKIGLDEMTRAIDRYKQKIAADGTEPRYVKQGSTFFNSGYVDYLDANYPESGFATPVYKPPRFEITRDENGQEVAIRHDE